MIVVLAILVIVLGALDAAVRLGVARLQVDMTNRFQAQQNARLALDRLRREIHCASEVKLSDATAGGGTPRRSRVTLGDVLPDEHRRGCDDVTWCTAGSATPSATRSGATTGVRDVCSATPGVSGPTT